MAADLKDCLSDAGDLPLIIFIIFTFVEID